ncbi:uncharacterized protein LOC128397717 [Panonychus citri]|uniref:uncharacterized protein LOC128397717 n=1 Tax=Panonychus citri TaxID=50023 RepID=UPI002307063B|nr:uncharacterized protein LOC128397717 [Panonychus citri]
MESSNRDLCSHSLPNLDSTINSATMKPSSTVMVTYPISEEDKDKRVGIANLAYEPNDDDYENHNHPISRPSSSMLHHSHVNHHTHSPHPISKSKAISDTEYLCHPGSSSSSTGHLHHSNHQLSSPTDSHHQVYPPSSSRNHNVNNNTSNGNLINGETNLGSRLFSTQSCDFDVVPVFTLNRNQGFNGRRISRTTRIVISTSLISFGITIMIVGILVYTVRDIEIGFNPYKINRQANVTTPYEAYLVHQTVDSIINDERRYNASVGSMFMSFGALAVIIGISLLLAPAIKRKHQIVNPIRSSTANINTNSNKNLSSIVYFNRDDLNRSQLSVEKIDIDHHGSRKEFF